MTTPAPDFALHARLLRLERSNRRLAALAVAALAVLLLPAFAPGRGTDVEATSVKLLDAAGKMVGVWHTDARGLPRLELFDGGEKPRIELGITTDDLFVNLRDRKGLIRAGLGLDAGGRPHLLLCKPSGHPSLHIASNDKGEGNLVVFDASGSICAGLGIDVGGKTWVLPKGETPAPEPEDQKAHATGTETDPKKSDDASKSEPRKGKGEPEVKRDGEPTDLPSSPSARN